MNLSESRPKQMAQLDWTQEIQYLAQPFCLRVAPEDAVQGLASRRISVVLARDLNSPLAYLAKSLLFVESKKNYHHKV